MTVWVKIFHFLHGGRKLSPTETRERFEQQGENSFDESKKGAVGCFMKELTGKNKVQTILSRRGQNSNIKLASSQAGLRAVESYLCSIAPINYILTSKQPP